MTLEGPVVVADPAQSHLYLIGHTHATRVTDIPVGLKDK